MPQSKKKVILVCSECLSRNYTIQKSTISQRERLQIKKHCITCNAHVLHKETR
ncbi:MULTISPECIES: 50S ribosomal protein L33 [Spiroplasma]|uniref:Large ribosomal subunit protein bL33 n=3 Tax=Spiroplasmataceae TaxID=2131 RepID=S5M142_9MOLU|nr:MULTISPECIES: 50S ribosomal protein L33 [Spiroplasma]AGR41737.1 50s ribosomal protein L33 [Spiroplasma diminutum CUAS-1]ALD65943.1 50s ribosomal protein L33 [Spiroplasma cantharicola]